MHIKTTMRYYLTLVRMAIIEQSQRVNAGEGVKKGNFLHVGRNVNWCSTMEECEGSLKN